MTFTPSGKTVTCLAALLAALIIMIGCGGSTPPRTGGASPAVTLSVTSLTFSSQALNTTSAGQAVTVTNSGAATLSFTSIALTGANASDFSQSNTCGTSIAAGAACAITVTFRPTAAGTRNATLSITDNATGSPHTVALTGTAITVSLTPSSLTFIAVVGETSAPQAATLSNSGTGALAVAISITGDFAQSNNCGASVAAGGSCTINVTFAPTVSGTRTGTLTVTDSVGTQTVSLTGADTVSNTAQVTVNLGPTGDYVNGIFTTVTVCEPGTTNCVDVPDVLVDTGSVGLRVLSSALTGVTLHPPQDSSNRNLNECVQYGDGSFNWGPVEFATVQIGGEIATQVPPAAGGTANSGIGIQVITADPVPTPVQNSGQCVVSANTPDQDTVATLGANGILGIGTDPQDCSIVGTNYCTTASGIGQLVVFPYWYCTSAGACTNLQTVPLQYQLWNPVAAFSSADTNGVALQLPSVPDSGAATVNGTLTFGIGTQSNNTLAGTVYEVDGVGDLQSLTYNGVQYTSDNSGGSFIDSGSNIYFVSDPTTLNTTDCVQNGTDIGYYCPSAPLTLPLTLGGSNGSSGSVSITIGHALNLFAANPSFAAFDDVGGPSCIPGTNAPCTTADDQWDLGLPVFFGRTVFIGISGDPTYPNGYWAF